jgi:hypothetical protein
MAQLLDFGSVHEAALNLASNGTTVTVPHLVAVLERDGIGCADAELRATVADLETRRYLAFTGQWDGDEKIYSVL